MHSKTILVSCGRTITLERASALFSSMDADVRALKVPPAQALSSGHDLGVDLLVIDDTDGGCDISAIEAELASGGDSTLFLMLDESRMKSVRLPVRCRRLLWPGEMTSDADFIHMGALTVNLATYQVKVNGEPIDLTFMEYALLSFLVTHPGRIYSREVLLSQVWGFDYYGGSRTVDVHVRRLRAKLGPEVAQHIETVRGAGYLWQS